MIRSGQSYACGVAEGSAAVLREPLSFYGGFDVRTGDIIGAHPDRGRNVAGCILVLPGGRGSSSSSSVLAEAIRLRTAPLGIVFARPDAIMVVGCIVAQTLYGLQTPMMACAIDGIVDRVSLHLACDAHGKAWLRQASPHESARETGSPSDRWTTDIF